MIDVEHEQRQRLRVTLGEADLGAEPLDEVAAVEGARQAVAQRRLEELRCAAPRRRRSART